MQNLFREIANMVSRLSDSLAGCFLCSTSIQASAMKLPQRLSLPYSLFSSLVSFTPFIRKFDRTRDNHESDAEIYEKHSYITNTSILFEC